MIQERRCTCKTHHRINSSGIRPGLNIALNRSQALTKRFNQSALNNG
jgi:hypothetical protein